MAATAGGEASDVALYAVTNGVAALALSAAARMCGAPVSLQQLNAAWCGFEASRKQIQAFAGGASSPGARSSAASSARRPRLRLERWDGGGDDGGLDAAERSILSSRLRDHHPLPARLAGGGRDGATAAAVRLARPRASLFGRAIFALDDALRETCASPLGSLSEAELIAEVCDACVFVRAILERRQAADRGRRCGVCDV